MTTRLDYFSAAPSAMEILLQQESYLNAQFKEDKTLLELIKLRVSQLNQCAYCIDMHSKDALAYGERTERLLGLNAWRDGPFFSEAEQVALEWSETLTKGESIPDEQYQKALSVFGESKLVDLTIAINAINSWNRVVKAFKPKVGDHQPS